MGAIAAQQCKGNKSYCVSYPLQWSKKPIAELQDTVSATEFRQSITRDRSTLLVYPTSDLWGNCIVPTTLAKINPDYTFIVSLLHKAVSTEIEISPLVEIILPLRCSSRELREAMIGMETSGHPDHVCVPRLTFWHRANKSHASILIERSAKVDFSDIEDAELLPVGIALATKEVHHSIDVNVHP